MKKKDLTKEQLIAIYDIVFNEVHSDGFKISETIDFLYSSEYYFLSQPNNNCMNKLTEYFKKINFDANKTFYKKHLTGF